FGLAFALVYFGIFEAVCEASVWLGLAPRAGHAAVVGGGLVDVMLPPGRPRMGTPWAGAAGTPLPGQPRLMLRDDGPRPAAVTFVLHLAYGAIVGAFAAGL